MPIPKRLRWWMAVAAVSRFPVGVAAVILDAQQNVLMFRHTYRGRYPWGLPSGWLKRHEDPAAGMVREIMEESGLTIRVTRPLLARSGSEFERLDLIFACELLGGQFRPSAEVVEMSWFTEGALPALMQSQYVMMANIFELVRSGEVS